MYQNDDFGVGYAIGRDSSNGNNNGWNDWSWIIALALIGGLFGNGGFGFGNNGNRGNCATVQDVASGFSTSEIMSDLNSIILGQANAINYTNQGFAGLNNALTGGFAGVNNAICTLGYQNQAGFNALSTQLANVSGRFKINDSISDTLS